MKKALIISALSGFISAFLKNDIKILQELGYEVHCVADGGNANTTVRDSIWDELGVTFHQISFDSKNPFSKTNIYAYFQIKNLLHELDFDLLHCHTPIAGFVSRLASRKLRKSGLKVIYTTHGFYFHKKSPALNWIIYYPIEKIASRWTDIIITINNEDLACAKKMHAKKCFKISSIGLDYNRFANCNANRDEVRKSININDEDILVLTAGELSKRKNHIVIIRALEILNNPRYCFVICGRAAKGQGTYDMLKSEADAANVRIQFLGYRNDMPEIIRGSDIFVLPSLREGLGMAGLQALAEGVPVIGSDVQGITDYVIPGKTGFLCDPNDSYAFAEAIRKLSNIETRGKMHDACKETAKKFDVSVSSSEMRTIYKSLQ